MSAPQHELATRLTSLEGRVGIVTGQSSGLGMAIAEVLADAGAKVYALNRTVREEAAHAGVTQWSVDVTDEAAVAEAVRRVGEADGIDFLVNNAGATVKKRAEDLTTAQWRTVHDVNIDALFTLAREAFPYLSRSEHVGRIVSIASMAAHLGFPEVTPYCASKAAVLGLTRGLAIEWAQDNVLVNSISPGWFPSEMNRSVLEADPDRERRILARIPLGRYGDPQNIADMALFLLSDAARYITAQDFAVDGGALGKGF